jgi:xanthine dehydrogenase small subunit
MRDTISFYLNGELKVLRGVAPTQTLLRYLREDEKLCGTKEGCAEGDCGACTVNVNTLSADGAVKREAINACIRFMPSLDGASVTTVEGLARDSDAPHPVQQAMMDSDASQCGFCTPGFVMSLYTAYRNRTMLPLAAANDVLAGNLCRCTGYGPILTAAEKIGHVAKTADQSNDDGVELEQLRSLDHQEPVEIEHGEARAFLPATSDQLADTYSAHPDATLIAGATDVGLWVTKARERLPKVIFLNRVRDLTSIKRSEQELVIGAGVTYSDAIDSLAQIYPDLGELVRRIGAVQVRNAGTLGGNIANGSPIGDMPPALIALDARLVLRHGAQRRTLPLEDFFLAYGRQDRKPGEFVEAVHVPLKTAADELKCYKISKRFDQDISALCGCFNIKISNGVVAAARIAFGGMAATPKRAPSVEAALIRKPWDRASVELAMQEFAKDFTPMSDMRASATYRLRTAQNLLLKYFLETQAPLAQTRLVGHGNAFL